MSGQPFKLLFVCAANTARSPLAEACMDEYLGPRRAGWALTSAGTKAVDGSPARPEAVELATSLGIDLSSHVSRALTADLVAWSDLVLCMGWDEVTYTWSLCPDSWERSFTIREFVHWAKQSSPRPSVLFASKLDRMRDRVDQAHAIRKRARADHGFWGGLRPQDFNLAEPNGAGPQAWTGLGQAMKMLVTDVVHLVGGP